jgi:hypothetical protein
LSEFSQADALSFAAFCESAFGDTAPKKLVNPDNNQDIRNLVYLESAGLVQGASGAGLTQTINFNAAGAAFLREGNILLVFNGEPGSVVTERVLALTPLGQELVSLVPSRDVRAAARRVGLSMRTPAIKSAYIGTLLEGKALPIEALWQEEAQTTGAAPNVGT